MQKITKENMKIVANDLMIDVDEDVVEGIILDFEEIQKHLELIKSIDVSGVKPMFLIDESNTSYLREDEPIDDNILKKEFILDNASRKNGDYVLVKKVVK